MSDKILKELKDMNKIFLKMIKFNIIEVQLIKSILLESQKQSRDIQKIKLQMEEKWPQ